MQIKLSNKFLSYFFQDTKCDLETSGGGSNFVYDGVNLLYYKCHKINFKRDGSYIDSPD